MVLFKKIVRIILVPLCLRVASTLFFPFVTVAMSTCGQIIISIKLQHAFPPKLTLTTLWIGLLHYSKISLYFYLANVIFRKARKQQMTHFQRITLRKWKVLLGVTSKCMRTSIIVILMPWENWGSKRPSSTVWLITFTLSICILSFRSRICALWHVSCIVLFPT